MRVSSNNLTDLTRIRERVWRKQIVKVIGNPDLALHQAKNDRLLLRRQARQSRNRFARARNHHVLTTFGHFHELRKVIFSSKMLTVGIFFPT